MFECQLYRFIADLLYFFVYLLFCLKWAVNSYYIIRISGYLLPIEVFNKKYTKLQYNVLITQLILLTILTLRIVDFIIDV